MKKYHVPGGGGGLRRSPRPRPFGSFGKGPEPPSWLFQKYFLRQRRAMASLKRSPRSPFPWGRPVAVSRRYQELIAAERAGGAANGGRRQPPFRHARGIGHTSPFGPTGGRPDALELRTTIAISRATIATHIQATILNLPIRRRACQSTTLSCRCLASACTWWEAST